MARKLLHILLLFLAACTAIQTKPTPLPPIPLPTTTAEITPIPAATITPLIPPTIIPTTIPEQPTIESTLPVGTEQTTFWDRLPSMSYEQIKAEAPVVNAKDYGLPENLQLYPSEVVDNGTEPRYVLYAAKIEIDGQSRDRVFLALDLKTGEVEHAIYIPNYQGITFMVLTDNSVASHSIWGRLNDKNINAEEMFGEAYLRAVAMRWWAELHPQEKPASSDTMPSLAELGYERYVKDQVHRLSREQRVDVVMQIRDRFLEALNEASNAQVPLELNLRDRHGTKYRPNESILIIVPTVDPQMGKQIEDRWNPMDSNMLSIDSQQDGELIYVYLAERSAAAFNYDRVRRELGSDLTQFLLAFFLNFYHTMWSSHHPRDYFQLSFNPAIIEAVCEKEDIDPKWANYFDKQYVSSDDLALLGPVPQCAVELR